MIPKNFESEYPTLYKSAEYLKNKTFIFKKTIPALFDNNYDFKRAERICKTGLTIEKNNWEKYFKNLDSLIELSLDFLKLQIELEKNRKYRYTSFSEVQEKVYSTDQLNGPNYLWGLYFSEVFWKIHKNMTEFYINEFVKNSGIKGTILEIPLGSGFFLTEFMRINKNWQGVGIDLAEKSIETSKKILKANNISEKSIKILKTDFFNYNENKLYDKIICGEFLEHVSNPLSILKKLNHMLTDNGKIFLTAAIWAGGIDHIYLYKSPSDVRKHIVEAGFKIEDELVQTVFEKDENNPEKGMIPVNYVSIISKQVC